MIASAVAALSLLLVACGGESRSRAALDSSPAPQPAKNASKATSSPSPANVDGQPRIDLASLGDGMRVVLLGTGTPVPSPERSGPALAIIAGGRPYLVDFGPGVVRRASLAHQRGATALDPAALDTALATHLHSDHTAGLSDLILTPAVVGRHRPLELFGPEGTVAMADHIVAAYATDLAIRGHGRGPAEMRGYEVLARDIKAGLVLTRGSLRVTAFDVPHGSFKAAFGYRFDDGKRRIVISGDTAPSDAVVDACDGCDVLVHEVYCKAGFDRGPSQFRQYHSSFHTSAPELGQLARRARPQLLVLSHLLLFGCTPEQLLREVRAHYDGDVAVGSDLDAF